MSRRNGATLVYIIIAYGFTWTVWVLYVLAARRGDPLHIAGMSGPTLILFVAGLSIVRVHNRWTCGWPVMVTLVGWLIILAGLFRMFAPEAQQAGQNTFTYAGLVVLLVIGIFVTFKAYGRGDG